RLPRFNAVLKPNLARNDEHRSPVSWLVPATPRSLARLRVGAICVTRRQGAFPANSTVSWSVVWNRLSSQAILSFPIVECSGTNRNPTFELKKEQIATSPCLG